MASHRDILLAALERWQREGDLDTPTYERLRTRAAAEPEPAAMAPGATASAVASASERGSFAVSATQFVGGLLLGASLVALVIFLDPGDDAARWLMAGLGGLVIAGAIVLQIMGAPERQSLVEAAFAAGFVPLCVGVVTDLGDTDIILATFGTAIAVGVHALKRGRGPTILLCVATVALSTFSATVSLFESIDGVKAGAWLVILLGYLGLTLVWRRESWSSAAAGALVIPLTVAFIMMNADIEAITDSVVHELLVGLFLGALMGLGLWLGVRGLVAASAAGLTIDAIVFAFDVGGALTAVFVLLALGGLLVWQGQGIRSYFGRAPKREGL